MRFYLNKSRTILIVSSFSLNVDFFFGLWIDVENVNMTIAILYFKRLKAEVGSVFVLWNCLKTRFVLCAVRLFLMTKQPTRIEILYTFSHFFSPYITFCRVFILNREVSGRFVLCWHYESQNVEQYYLILHDVLGVYRYFVWSKWGNFRKMGKFPPIWKIL